MRASRKTKKEELGQPAATPSKTNEDIKTTTAPVSDWPTFIYTDKASDEDIRNRLLAEIQELQNKFKNDIQSYQVIYLYDQPEHSIASLTSEKIYTALSKDCEKKSRNVLLILHSTGGSIEPAYQISKICCEFSKESFVVVVPRAAKSAATLICLGANQVHMDL